MPLVSPIADRIVRPIAGAISAFSGGGESLPKATHFVSQTATNGYAVGVDAGAGTSKAAPWLTITFAIANAPTGSIVAINDGTYVSGTFYQISSKSLELRAENRRLVILRAAAAQTRIVNFISASISTFLRCRGIVFDGLANTTRALTIGTAASTATLTTTFFDCLFKDVTLKDIFCADQKGMILRVLGCEGTGARAEFAIDVSGIESGSVDVIGFRPVYTAAGNATKALVNIVAAAAGPTALVRGVVGSLASSSATGGVYGVRVMNIAGAVIEQNNITVSGPASSVGALYWVFSANAALDASNGFIRNNQGANNCSGGYCAIYGQDGTTAGDNKHNNGTISGNVMTANSAAVTPIHGLMIGYGTGGDVFNNTVTGAGIASIAKQQIGGEFHDNSFNQFVSESIRSKGATGTTWRRNTVTISTSFTGDGINVDANDAPVTNSTGIVIDANIINVNAAPGKIVEVAVASDAVFTENTYNINTTLGADSWSYQGTTYDTLAEWKAAVEPTAHP